MVRVRKKQTVVLASAVPNNFRGPQIILWARHGSHLVEYGRWGGGGGEGG